VARPAHAPTLGRSVTPPARGGQLPGGGDYLTGGDCLASPGYGAVRGCPTAAPGWRAARPGPVAGFGVRDPARRRDRLMRGLTAAAT